MLEVSPRSCAVELSARGCSASVPVSFDLAQRHPCPASVEHEESAATQPKLHRDETGYEVHHVFERCRLEVGPAFRRARQPSELPGPIEQIVAQEVVSEAVAARVCLARRVQSREDSLLGLRREGLMIVDKDPALFDDGADEVRGVEKCLDIVLAAKCGMDEAEGRIHARRLHSDPAQQKDLLIGDGECPQLIQFHTGMVTRGRSSRLVRRSRTVAE